MKSCQRLGLHAFKRVAGLTILERSERDSEILETMDAYFCMRLHLESLSPVTPPAEA